MKRVRVVFADRSITERLIRVSLAHNKNRKRETNLMKSVFAALVVLLGLGAPELKAQLLTPVSNLTDILSEYTFGVGTNSSAMVIQWNDGLSPASIAWRFNWDAGTGTGEDSSVTGFDMIAAIAGSTRIYEVLPDYTPGDLIQTILGSDTRLQFDMLRYSWGDVVYAVSFTDGLNTRNQGSFLDGAYWEIYNFGGDFTSESGGNSFIGSYNAPGSFSNPNWTYTWSTLSQRELSDGSWDGYYFAVPEPSTWVLLGLSALTFGIWGIRRATRRV
jgi:hypothetical protein